MLGHTPAEVIRACILSVAALGGDAEAIVKEALRGVPENFLPRALHNWRAIDVALTVATAPSSPPPTLYRRLLDEAQRTFTTAEILDSARELNKTERAVLARVGEGHARVEAEMLSLWQAGEYKEAARALQTNTVVLRPVPQSASRSSDQSRAVRELAKAGLLVVNPIPPSVRPDTPGAKNMLRATPKGIGVYHELFVKQGGGV